MVRATIKQGRTIDLIRNDMITITVTTKLRLISRNMLGISLSLLAAVLCVYHYVNMGRMFDNSLSMGIAPYDINSPGCNEKSTMSIRDPLSKYADIRNETSYFMFLRIPKTGSTSILTFLTKRSGLKTIDNFVEDIDQVIHSIEDHSNVAGDLTQTGHQCVFGDGKLSSMVKTYEANPTKKFNCAHFTFNKLQNYYAAISQLAPRSSENTTIPARTFTIVREPFDRWRSYFYYVRKYVNKSQLWRKQSSIAQYNRIRDGDLEGWMKLIAEEDDGPPWQFEYLSNGADDISSVVVNNAISMIEGDSPQVYVFINECFELSLRRIGDMLSIAPEAVDNLIASSNHFQMNRGEYEEEDDHIKKLRESVKVWWPEEYKFYDAAVEQFKRQMTISSSSTNFGTTTSLLETECLARLTKKGSGG